MSRPIPISASASLITLRDGADFLLSQFGRHHATGAQAYTLERLSMAAASGSLSDISVATLQLRAFLTAHQLTEPIRAYG
ncbi:hypothetical protein [Azorhizobium oxalatiphilum]|uniref:hypothetical protein n=1 Tax=Azorhizobium oxalatiphilum TaxID=980631 RepID=UPI001664DBE7|nr:hypothetical protein [Azorhizobium oxalatiphilum]